MSTVARSDIKVRTSPEPVRGPMPKAHLGLIVAASFFTSLILALVLTVVVFGGATEPVITGVALLAFALGWTMLARIAGLLYLIVGIFGGFALVCT